MGIETAAAPSPAIQGAIALCTASTYRRRRVTKLRVCAKASITSAVEMTKLRIMYHMDVLVVHGFWCVVRHARGGVSCADWLGAFPRRNLWPTLTGQWHDHAARYPSRSQRADARPVSEQRGPRSRRGAAAGHRRERWHDESAEHDVAGGGG